MKLPLPPVHLSFSRHPTNLNTVDATIGDYNEERHASWLELFFDLIFVVAISALADRLTHDISWQSLVKFGLLFWSTWWIWSSKVVFATRFSQVTNLGRLASFTMMVAAAAMATQIGHVYETNSTPYVLAFLLARSVLLLLYLRVRFQIPAARQLSTIYLLGFGLGALMWVVSLFVLPPDRYLWWIAGMIIELATPLIGRSILSRSRVNTSHLPERLGLFVIIVLGEAVARVIHAMAELEWTFSSIMASLLLFAFAFALWWLYFNYLELATFRQSLHSGIGFIYSHMLLIISLTAISAGAGLAIEEIAEHDALETKTVWLLAGGAATWLVSFLLVLLITLPHRPKNLMAGIYLGGVVAVIALGLVNTALTAWAILGGLLVIFGAVLLLELLYLPRYAVPLVQEQ